MNIENTTHSKNNVALVATLFLILFALCLYAGMDWYYASEHAGRIRSLIMPILSAVFALALVWQRQKLVPYVAYAVISISIIGVIDLLIHNPGASLFGLSPRFPDDFNINFYGAQELYGCGDSPYDINSKYQLTNTSNSFPFPTYLIYWLCSGLGYLGKSESGLVLTILNLLLAFLLIKRSMRIANMNVPSLFRDDSKWPALILVFLVLDSMLWGVIMNGQTPIIAAYFLIAGLWYTDRQKILYEVFCGCCFALSIMIKPNYAPFLLYFIISWRGAQNYHCPRIFLFIICAVVIFIILTIAIPGGVHQGTYSEFINKVMPVLESKTANWSVSLVGIIAALFPDGITPYVLSIILTALAVIIGLYRKLSWHTWLVISLLLSPITWPSYTVVLL
ncbi:MAG: hypothetical protein AB1599_09625, partial [Planctomycetota bacterium]